jgi:hypothetical protein
MVIEGDLEPIKASEVGHYACCGISCLALPLGFIVVLLGGCYPDCCLIAQVFDHRVDSPISKVDLL